MEQQITMGRHLKAATLAPGVGTIHLHVRPLLHRRPDWVRPGARETAKRKKITSFPKHGHSLSILLKFDEQNSPI